METREGKKKKKERRSVMETRGREGKKKKKKGEKVCDGEGERERGL
jgi:hypothetical protein